MGEIFTRPSAAEVLECTGERLTAALTGETAIEHWHRYLLARELARGLDVLDIASGEGYGTALLAQTARKATGVEISAETVAHAARSYIAGNLSYMQGDARSIPLPDSSVDLVVSFETLEHFYEQDAFITEVRRVLRPGGALLISTPDRDTYSPAVELPNPHHVLELTAAQFDTLLRRHFGHVVSRGQRVLLGSALLGDETGTAPDLTFERRGPQHFEASAGMSRARFIISLASDDTTRTLPSSIYIDTDKLGYTDGPALEALKTERDTLARRCAALEESCERAEEAVRIVRNQVSTELVEEAIAAIKSSTSWRITAPLRALSRRMGRN